MDAEAIGADPEHDIEDSAAGRCFSRFGFELSDDEKIDVVASRILSRHRQAFEELAK